MRLTIFALDLPDVRSISWLMQGEPVTAGQSRVYGPTELFRIKRLLYSHTVRGAIVRVATFISRSSSRLTARFLVMATIHVLQCTDRVIMTLEMHNRR
jgi:hypothetical protein